MCVTRPTYNPLVVCGRDQPDPHREAADRRRGARGGPPPARVGLGCAGAGGRTPSRRRSRLHRRRARGRGQLGHDRAARRGRRARPGAGRRGHRPRVHVGLDRERRRVHRRDAGLLRRRPRDLQPRRRAARRAGHAAGRSASSRCTCSGSAPRWTTCCASRAAATSGCSRTAACSLGGWYRRRAHRPARRPGCLSFHPRKSITTGEGGMVITATPSSTRASRSLRDHGAVDRAGRAPRRPAARSCSPTTTGSATTSA